eukprot:gene10013-10167_t
MLEKIQGLAVRCSHNSSSGPAWGGDSGSGARADTTLAAQRYWLRRQRVLHAEPHPSDADIIELNVPGSLLCLLFDPDNDQLLVKDTNNRVFLDHDPAVFSLVLRLPIIRAATSHPSKPPPRRSNGSSSSSGGADSCAAAAPEAAGTTLTPNSRVVNNLDWSDKAAGHAVLPPSSSDDLNSSGRPQALPQQQQPPRAPAVAYDHPATDPKSSAGLDNVFVGATSVNHIDQRGLQIPSFGWRQMNVLAADPPTPADSMVQAAEAAEAFAFGRHLDEGQIVDYSNPQEQQQRRQQSHQQVQRRRLWRSGDLVQVVLELGRVNRLLLKVNGQEAKGCPNMLDLPTFRQWCWYLALFRGTEVVAIVFQEGSFSIYNGDQKLKRFLQ